MSIDKLKGSFDMSVGRCKQVDEIEIASDDVADDTRIIPESPDASCINDHNSLRTSVISFVAFL